MNTTTQIIEYINTISENTTISQIKEELINKLLGHKNRQDRTDQHILSLKFEMKRLENKKDDIEKKYRMLKEEMIDFQYKVNSEKQERDNYIDYLEGENANVKVQMKYCGNVKALVEKELTKYRNDAKILNDELSESRQDERVLKNRVNSLVRIQKQKDKTYCNHVSRMIKQDQEKFNRVREHCDKLIKEKRELQILSTEFENDCLDEHDRDFNYTQRLKQQIVDLGGKPIKLMVMRKKTKFAKTHNFNPDEKCDCGCENENSDDDEPLPTIQDIFGF